MRISLNWLKDFLVLKENIQLEDIKNALTMAGLEVESVEDISLRAKKISLIKNIIKKGQKDTQVEYEIETNDKKRKLYGPEIPLTDNQYIGIIGENKNMRFATYADLGLEGFLGDYIIIDDDEKVKAPNTLLDIPSFNDIILTLGITPNRSDALSHVGIARELCAALGLSKKNITTNVTEMSSPTHEKAVVEIENPTDCPRYALRIIEDVKIGSSPLWLRARLLMCGVRPINNAVDITNYVMLSLGQPMHVFDYDKLNKESARVKIKVTRGNNEKFIALDKSELELSKEDIVIYDAKEPVALAGVIGGEKSAVTEGTKRILLESAHFNETLVRKSARHHGISTDSSYRFERGVDPNGVGNALDFAAELLAEVTKGDVCREAIDVYRLRSEPKEISLRLKRAQSLLGLSEDDLDEEKLRDRFRILGIETILKRGDTIYFRVPTFRPDLTREIDLIEEVARMVGYDKVVQMSSKREILSTAFIDEEAETITTKLKSHLISRGFFEAVNYAFLDKEYQNRFLLSEEKKDVIPLQNPLSSRYNVMRISLVPGLLKNLKKNASADKTSIKLFEVGTIFLGKQTKELQSKIKNPLLKESYADERQVIAAISSGFRDFNSFDQGKIKEDFYQLKGVVSECLKKIGLKDDMPFNQIRYEKLNSDIPYLHPGESCRITFKDEDATEYVGYLGRVHPDIAEFLDIDSDTFCFEMFLDPLEEHTKKSTLFTSYSKYPMISRDVALVVEESVMAADLISLSKDIPIAHEILQQVDVFDVYRGKNVEKGKKSIALSFDLQHTDRTLTDEEASSFITSFTTRAKEAFNAQVR